MTEAGWTHVANVKAEGWYWWRRSVGYHKALKVYSVAGSLCVAQGDDHVPIEEIDGGEWLGPITPDSYQQGRVEGLREAGPILAKVCEWYEGGTLEQILEEFYAQLKLAQQAQKEKGEY